MEPSISITHDSWRDTWRATERPRSGWSGASTLRPTRRYEIISELSGGAMSSVRLAHDTVTGSIVAIKSLAPDAEAMPGARRRFAREAAIVARLQHPNIVRTESIEREGDTPVAIVTEYVRGHSLRDALVSGALVSGARIPIDRAVHILRDVASALAYAHAQGVVHCDVKPANILLDEEHDRAVLIDFGIACETGTRPDSDDADLTVGTPAYMAPEQIEARAVDPRTDVYALCVVAWELLAGRMPWLGAPLADVLHRQRYESLPDLALVRPDIPVYLLNAINGGLAKDPARRWRDGAELMRHLSPRALSVVPKSFEDPALDATMLVDRRPARPSLPEPHPALEPTLEREPEREPQPEPELYGTAPRRRTHLVASSIVLAILLVLGSLAPRLSHATEHPPAAIDPELDSMLTLAVAGHSTGGAATASQATHACFDSARPGASVHCAAGSVRAVASHGGARRHHSHSRRRASAR